MSIDVDDVIKSVNDASDIIVVESVANADEAVVVVETVVGEDDDNNGVVFEAVADDSIGVNPCPPSKSPSTDGMDKASDEIVAEYEDISPGFFDD